jgi:hypothetical protein
MNKMKYLAAMLIAVAGLGLQQAQAHLINPQTFTVPGGLHDPQGERDYLVTNGYMEDCCQFLFKVNNDGTTDGLYGQYFTVDRSDPQTWTVTWDFGTSGITLCGALIKDGGNPDQLYRFYSVSGDELTAGDGTVTFADVDRNISHISFFGCFGEGVPDGGTTVMLLGAALGALGMARRFLMS